MKSAFESVLEMAQSAILHSMGAGPLTQADIAAKVDMVLEMPMGWKEQVDRAEVIKTLELRFSIWIGRVSSLSDDTDHIHWLEAARKQGWRYWPRYRQWLEAKWSPVAVEKLDEVTDEIVKRIEDPQRAGRWDRRGLVVGHVQSGKTANYTGAICKAADAGYKLIVVLAGMHKNLRSQTQMRLDEGFLGYETMPTRAQGNELRSIGVGTIDSDPSIRPDYVTNRSDGGDFKKSVANSMGVSPGTRPWLFVVKKNASVLRNLLSWVEELVADTHDSTTGRPVVSNLPLLVIDDEADHGSVDTGEQEFDENGVPDPEYEPKTINRLIRRLLFAFDKSAYIGYTATPFANIFIHEQKRTAEHGEDLFPRSFIINLPAPSNYAGPVRIFGLDPQNGEEEGTVALPLVRHVADHADSLALKEKYGWMPPLHKNGHTPLCQGLEELPDSLKTAILAFLLSCAARRVRKQEREHNSMLVHVTRFTKVQKIVTRQVSEYLTGVRRRLKRGTANESLLSKLKQLWDTDFGPTTRQVQAQMGDSDMKPCTWGDILAVLPVVAEDIHVREINGTAKDILDYETHRETGLSVIAIGGDKLARGLTLEGLTVSYFLRSAKMYDTLMQMGRWFGYRPGYLDLCRLYTTPDLEEWFQHITEASEELRQEFDHMVAIGGTPRDYGLKVKSHPVLMVTSRVKMKNSFELKLAFAGDIQETVVFHRDSKMLHSNITVTENLLRKLGKGTSDPVRMRPDGKQHAWQGTCLWGNVPGRHVADFLREFTTHEAAVKVNSRVMADYVERQLVHGELTAWTVALMSADGEALAIGEHHFKAIERSPNIRCYSVEEQKRLRRFIIRRILAPRDEAIDIDAGQYSAALELTRQAYVADAGRSRRKTPPDTPSGQAIRQIRGKGRPDLGIPAHPERGLLLVYPLSPAFADIDFAGPVVGFGVSFPDSDNVEPVAYKVNNIYWGQEYGGNQ